MSAASDHVSASASENRAILDRIRDNITTRRLVRAKEILVRDFCRLEGIQIPEPPPKNLSCPDLVEVDTQWRLQCLDAIVMARARKRLLESVEALPSFCLRHPKCQQPIVALGRDT